jgi:putative Mg2+ transporter-C (MgtC) family protein
MKGRTADPAGGEIMEPWWRSLADDFSDLPDLGQTLQVAVRLLIAAALGGALGWERERAGKQAGLRTHMLVSLGAALFVLVPQQAGMALADLSRVIQGVVAGVGFLGTGTILKQSEEGLVKGLTTAAGIWLTAALGMAAGLGREATALLGALLAVLVLSAVYRLERWMGWNSESKPADPSN